MSIVALPVEPSEQQSVDALLYDLDLGEVSILVEKKDPHHWFVPVVISEGDPDVTLSYWFDHKLWGVKIDATYAGPDGEVKIRSFIENDRVVIDLGIGTPPFAMNGHYFQGEHDEFRYFGYVIDDPASEIHLLIRHPRVRFEDKKIVLVRK